MLDGRAAPDLPPRGRAEVWIDCLEPADTGWWRRTRTVHHHRHFDPSDVLHRAADAGLAPVATYGSHLTGRLDAEVDESVHVKAVLIARG